jgi:hypothetical protein
VEVIKEFSTGYHSRNGGGDLIITDSDLPMIDVRPVDRPEVIKVEPTASRDKRPAQIVLEAAVAFFRRLIFCSSRCSSCRSPANTRSRCMPRAAD